MGKLVLALTVAAAGAFLYQHRDWPSYWRLEREGVGCDGWVIGKRDGGRIDYSYEGPTKIHTATGDGGYGNPDFDELAVGDRVIVYFLPSAPDVSTLGLPALRLRYQHELLVWALLIAGPAIAWALRRELSRAA